MYKSYSLDIKEPPKYKHVLEVFTPSGKDILHFPTVEEALEVKKTIEGNASKVILRDINKSDIAALKFAAIKDGFLRLIEDVIQGEEQELAIDNQSPVYHLTFGTEAQEQLNQILGHPELPKPENKKIT